MKESPRAKPPISNDCLPALPTEGRVQAGKKTAQKFQRLDLESALEPPRMNANGRECQDSRRSAMGLVGAVSLNKFTQWVQASSDATPS
jgi:hypothetical protein